MKKFKMTVAAVALLLGTFGVFAGKPSFTAGLYAKKGTSTAIHLANTVDATTLQTTVNGLQVQITDHAGTAYPLFGQSNFTSALYEISTGW